MGNCTNSYSDDIQNTVVKTSGKQVQRQLNPWINSHLAGEDYKFNTRLEILDGQTTAPMETWGLEGCFLQNVDYSDSDYTTNEPVTVTLTIRFDNALHVPGDGNGAGSTVAGGSGEVFPETNVFGSTASDGT